jgi:glycosyltransferase involved in cell wall biosynthesis
VARRNLSYLLKYPTDQVTIVSPGFTPPEDVEPPPRAALDLPDGPLVTMIPSREFDPGYLLILDMLHRLLKRQPDVHLAVVGAGPTVTELQHKSTGIRPALPIRWLGERADQWAVIATSDVIVDCLSKDDVPPALIMAALAGKPIVAPRLLGTAEIIEPNVNGLLVTPGDTNDMAIQISRLLSYEGLSHRLGRMARRRGIERFSVEAQRKAITTFYESTIYTYR